MSNLYVALENLRSLYNIGAIFRTCSFFGVKNVLLVGYSGKNILPNGKVVLHEDIKKSSLGSESDLEITFLKDPAELIKFAEEKNFNLVSVEQNEKSVLLQNWKPVENTILIFGNEVTGVSPEVLEKSKEIIEVERKGKHNSLNVTTTAGIVLFEATRKGR